MRFLESGAVPLSPVPPSSMLGSPSLSAIDSSAQKDKWYVLELKRSRWYDVFDKNDRVQILRGIWGISHWGMRKIGCEHAGSA